MMTKRSRSILMRVIAALVGWFVLHTLYICIDGLRPYQGRADVAIVLGNTVYADSTLSPWLLGRVDQALELYQSGRVKKIFVSGGKGEFGVKEGDAMRGYLLRHQVPDSVILSDNEGKNTYWTALDFMKLNRLQHFQSAIVVSSYYHITRTKFILRKLGFRPVYGVASQSYFWWDLFGIFREFFAFYKYALWY